MQEDEEKKGTGNTKILSEAIAADIENLYGSKPEAILFGFRNGDYFGGGIDGSVSDIASIIIGIISKDFGLTQAVIGSIIKVIGFDTTVQLAMKIHGKDVKATDDVIIPESMNLEQANIIVSALVKKFPTLSPMAGLIASSKNNQLLN